MKKNKPFDREAFDGDVLDLFRKVIGTVRLSDVKEFDTLRGQDRIDFLRFCSQVYSNKFFLEITKQIAFHCALSAALETRNFDEVLVNRAEASGVKLVENFFAKYYKKYVDEFEKEPEEFDERNPFPAVE